MNAVGGERVRDIGNIAILPEAISVVPLEPIRRSDPDKAEGIPNDVRAHPARVGHLQGVEMKDGEQPVLRKNG